ncbi:MAG: LytTR family DNA-binding domain-containing protein [Acidobacteriota bacterium]|nr:LytTR family DNA-binding domain-containing protein [Acidobacteriota bacterium]
MIRAFLVDDEELAIRRLSRMLLETGRIEISGTSTDPVDAIAWLSSNQVDVVFLDIQMPGMNGFEMLSMLDPQPMVVFTTAYNQYALKAFQVHSVDYLVKPVEQEHLARTIKKLERLRVGEEQPDAAALMRRLTAALNQTAPAYPDRIATARVGDRTQFLELARVTHFFAEDKLTYAATKAKNHLIDHTITELESRLDPKRFFRIHRSTLLNLTFVQEMDSWFGGGALVRLKDEKGTELPVARDRVRGLKERLGI